MKTFAREQAVVHIISDIPHNASNTEESASASEEMNSQAGNLNDMVQELVAIVGGSAQAQGNGNVHHFALAHTDLSAHAKQADRKRAEQSIPLDADGDFMEF